MESELIALPDSILQRLIEGKDSPPENLLNGRQLQEDGSDPSISTSVAIDAAAAAFQQNTDLATRTEVQANEISFRKRLNQKKTIPEGERDDTLFRAACLWAGDLKRTHGSRVFDDADRFVELRNRVHDLNRSRSKPPLDEATVDQKVTQGIKNALKEPGTETKPLGDRYEKALLRLDDYLQSKMPERLYTDDELLEAIAILKRRGPLRYAEVGVKIRRHKDLSKRDFDAALSPVLQELGQTVCKDDDYRVINGCHCRVSANRDGETTTPLCNFVARIVEEVTYDDGAERKILLRIEGRLASGQSLPMIEVPGDRFAGMSWVSIWGVNPIVFAGFGLKDHLRVAIQKHSVDAVRRTVYGHSGWREVDSKWLYLHGGGAIGTVGTVTGIQVELPGELKSLTLPDPPATDQLRSDFAAIRRFLELGPLHVMYSLLAAISRAIVGGADFSIHVCGPTGVFKSEAAALSQQFFGPLLDARHLPGSWSSTENALEGITFSAKDTLFVLDDFAPTGSKYDVQKYHQKADRIFRGLGNHSGRQRMMADGSLRPTRPPRALILSTGEDVPLGQSLRARSLILEISPRDIAANLLTESQRDARGGAYARVVAGFIQHLASRVDELRAGWRDEVSDMRTEFETNKPHARTPMLAAELVVALRLFFTFLKDSGTISGSECGQLIQAGIVAIRQAAQLQSIHQVDAEPTAKFLNLLSAALVSGRCHIAAPDGQAPPGCQQACGWREKELRGRDMLESIPESQGKRIGWIDGDDIYLEPGAAFAEVQSLATTQGDGFSVTQQTLIKRLKEKRLLASTDEDRQRNTVRRVLAGTRRNVLHLKSTTLFPAAETVPTVPSDENVGRNGTVSRDSVKTDTDHCPTGPPHSVQDSQRMGQLGQSGATTDGEPEEKTSLTDVDWQEGVL